jgi:transglutaminase-like putative cysteine protease
MALAVPTPGHAASPSTAQPHPDAPGSAILHSILEDWTMRFQVAADLTYTEDFSQDWTMLTDRGVAQNSRDAVTFHPTSQALKLVEAWVTQPDGSRLTVAADAVFTRPSAAAQDAPGFTASETMTVVFPQLHPGSRTHVAWRLTQKTPPVNGFNVWVQVPLEVTARHIGVTLQTPSGVALHTAIRGPFRDSATDKDGVHTQTVEIENAQAQEAEPNAVDAADFQPMFLATSLPGAEAIGAIYARESAARAKPTPEIEALAARVAGTRKGIDAARAVYDWVAANIRYVAVYMNPNDGWVPHDAASVLRAGYGDCKDHVVLMQAMLAARGIDASAALVSYGDAHAPLPLWLPTQYNHAIVYLPQFHHFANPTDPFAGFDAADRHLAGKQVVLAMQEGALARIPERKAADDAYRVDSTLDLALDGTVQGHAVLNLSPSIDSSYRRMVAHALSPQDLAQRLLDDTPEGGFGTVTSSDPRDLDSKFSMVADWRSPHAVSLRDGAGFAAVPAGIDVEPPASLRGLLSPRRAPTHDFTAGALDFTWHVVWRLPAGVTASRLPRDVEVANDAGRYTANYRLQGDRIEVTRHLTVAKDVFGPSAYAAFDALIEAPLADAREVIGFAPEARRASL